MICINDTAELKLNNCAVALGKFDGLHRGHMLLINKLAELKNQGFTSAVYAIDMGKSSIYTYDERAEILDECRVDYLINSRFTKEFADIKPKKFVEDILVKRLGVRHIVVGSDFHFGSKRQGDVNTLIELGKIYKYEVTVMDKLRYGNSVISSTAIKEFLSEGNIERVNNFLGREYKITGEIVHGNHFGRTINYPTINITPDKNKILPCNGVYKVRVIIDGKIYSGVSNVGKKPTVQKDGPVNVETYIFDFNCDVYGKKAEILFEGFIRKEMKFENIEVLKNQMAQDVLVAKRDF